MQSFWVLIRRGFVSLSVLILVGLLVTSAANADLPPKLLKQIVSGTQVIAHVKVSKLAFVVAPESDGTWGECLVEGSLIKFKKNNLKLKKHHWAKLALPCLRTLDAGKKRKKGKSLPPEGPMSWRNLNTVGIGLIMEVYLNKTNQAGFYEVVLGKAKVVGGKKVDGKVKVYEPKAPKPQPKTKSKGETPPPQKPFSKKEQAKAQSKAVSSSAKSSKKPSARTTSVKKDEKKAAKKDDDDDDEGDDNEDEEDAEEIED